MISQAAEYGLRASVHLATHNGAAPSTAKDIAEAVRAPVGYLHKILRMLSHAGLLKATRGPSGGFTLAKSPDSISVLDVLNATNSELPRIRQCPLGKLCHKELCPLHQLLDSQMERTEHVFASTSIADLMHGQGAVQSLCITT